ncbi:aspartate-semialdehyde dehydrogenase [Alicyclobacillus sp. SO9]|uniref:aspartate-semialdehyde dehydrogenase n=1 Tax=Alicyclobacillus sp. SO9 TaxID=2665646 RepID=UPI0018E72350|nr:aspartate-semialdehyde dehydrogenase [Alicyclobacillus sp. SO9]QQE80858.1 aspartate-semialdehyde dehydrogenase [Alicyclobacillus sp. SO9]
MKKKQEYTVAVLGATGAVGRAMIQTLERRDFPVGKLVLLASPRSAGETITFCGEELTVEAAGETSFQGVDIALFSAGATASKEFAPIAVNSGAVVIDNSSAFRMDAEVPLVVPEANSQEAFHHNGIIANPNCSTIQLMVAVKPLLDLGLERIAVSTYQAVSGMGQKGISGLEDELAGMKETTAFPVASLPYHYPMAGNVLAQCDVFLDNGYTKEEMKLVNESRKILSLPNLEVVPTAVRVPVVYGHAESVELRFKDAVTAASVRERLQDAPGVVVADNPGEGVFPHPKMAQGSTDTYVGRIRQSLGDDKTVLMFVVADNLLKGAAWNAVQIAELLAGLPFTSRA